MEAITLELETAITRLVSLEQLAQFGNMSAKQDLMNEKLDLLVSAVHDDGGTFVGVMATWDIVTQKLETENEVARVRNMMENAPFNVMYANVETFTIDYLNPSSIKTLKGIEEHLPVRVDDLQGVAIDSFHADPAVQRVKRSWRGRPGSGLPAVVGSIPRLSESVSV